MKLMKSWRLMATGEKMEQLDGSREGGGGAMPVNVPHSENYNIHTYIYARIHIDDDEKENTFYKLEESTTKKKKKTVRKQ